MTAHTLVVSRPEDVVLDFFSVLDTTPDESVSIRQPGHAPVVLPPVPDPESRWRQWTGTAPAVSDAEPAGPLPAPAPGTIWTHSPADDRPDRRDLARAVAHAAPGPVRQAVGESTHLQMVGAEARPLTPEQVARKLAVLNAAHPELLAARSPAAIGTARVPSVEQFLRLGPRACDELWALMASLGPEASSVHDPWEFATSAYERDRLDATASWVRGALPDRAVVVEVGACEGALTRRLHAHGLAVRATEPDPRFRDRLRTRVPDDVPVLADPLDALATASAPAADAYLLVEMMYYGQPLDLLDRLRTDTVLLAATPEYVAELPARMGPDGVWAVGEPAVLVAPRLETVAGGCAYLRKAGSDGVVLTRVDPR